MTAVAGPVDDGDVPRFWRELRLPGLVDMHVHFMPLAVMDKVWGYFDTFGSRTGTPWPITYREEEGRRLARLRDMGVRAFPSLIYPHKPGMAEWLNDWATGFARAHEDVVHTATFFPEPGAPHYVARALDEGARLVKVHVQVGGFDPRDPALEPVWGLLAEAGTIVVIHCNSGLVPGRFTGPGPIAEVLARHPRLRAVIAHLGMPDYAEFLALARRYEHVHLDTTLAFTDLSEARAPFPRALRPVLRDLIDRVVLGTDFPNTPYPYAHQLEALARLDLGDDWLRAVVHDNGARLLGLSAADVGDVRGDRR
jgi:hypothetical protein